MADPFVKRRSPAPPGFFEAEAAGLRWLSDGGARTATVLAVDDEHIELDRVATTGPSRENARSFGGRLARVHDAGAAEYGSPPAGYTGPLYIGQREMGAGIDASWGRFYGRERVRPFLGEAVDAGHLTTGERDVVERACDLVESGAFDGTTTAPARLHGDLWNGNVLWTRDGVVLIDPAAHGGHRETDLAMLDLFGCPHLDEIVAAYESASPLAAGWRSRIPLHQLHPLAVHAAGHGRGYGIALADAAQQTLALA
ncbi:fructosamine kinase [Rhodococcus rhodnii]|uniref:Fructosamine kinase n=2 Tax=Rhodococcus rhodnii TaxID=38312 RepID=R7WN01_9NOCA|nr:fructosamine kinase family protein [Rhodococcus rhodnii]EOM76682.1 hypothetical protein Rrhod_1959 [Rhodococcus rhodnii LMG 5362]TXG92006.1 fructosamine kinase [Rhodococcus rhodnii]